jgi:hypothetical protein
MLGSELGDDSGLRNGLANGSTTFFCFLIYLQMQAL